ncbi:hypothetical protein HA402_011341 [Bradysia odoriphaga]|nr:hypothetical protein HA402_011341 [Bradysia odoriphaga]
MERLAMEVTKRKELPEKMFLNWESTALNGGGAYRIFNFILSYILNHPLYVLSLHTNQWREYNLTVANSEKTQFHSEFAQESLPFDYMGPPFMHAEHMEQSNDGTILTTHVAAIIHESFYDSDDRLDHTYALRFESYLSFMKLAPMRSLYPFVFAGDMPKSTVGQEVNELVEGNK